MNLEAHPVIHYILEFCCYNLGLLANVLVAAHLSNQSKNNGVKTLAQYFALRWIPLGTRWLVCLFLFLLVWHNPALSINSGMEKLVGTSVLPHMGLSGFLGYLCDHFMGQVTALLGMQRELPAVPPADGTT